jgi:hypothetical protein
MIELNSPIYNYYGRGIFSIDHFRRRFFSIPRRKRFCGNRLNRFYSVYGSELIILKSDFEFITVVNERCPLAKY